VNFAVLVGAIWLAIIDARTQRSIVRDAERKELGDTNVKVIEESFMPEIEKPPHEVFPELIYWDAGDLVTYKPVVLPYETIFLGLHNYEIVLRNSTSLNLYRISAEQAADCCLNRKAQQRAQAKEEKTILKGIENNPYNDTLKVLRKQKEIEMEYSEIEWKQL
jgi:hypothetical protein